jgi:hypothetical protein
MPFKILHHFVGDSGVLREIQMLENNPDNDTQWQWSQFGSEPISLTYVSKNGPVTTFAEGNVVFDHIQGTFTFYNTVYKLKRTR